MQWTPVSERELWNKKMQAINRTEKGDFFLLLDSLFILDFVRGEMWNARLLFKSQNQTIMWCNSETDNLVFKLTENRIHIRIHEFSLTNEIAVWLCGFNRTQKKKKKNKECYRSQRPFFSVVYSSARAFQRIVIFECVFCFESVDFCSVWWRADNNLRFVE